MENERVAFLRASLTANPEDAFARYALALELTRAGQSVEAWEHFQYLLEHHPDYSAAYYQAGTLLANQGRTDDARRVFSQGVEVTRRLGQKHAESELMAALDGLE
jgi:Flp pilus assembly protein TadD